MQSPVKTRRDCDNCSSSKKVNIALKYRLKEVKSKHHQLRSCTANVKRRLNLKSKDQTLRRRSSKIEELKARVQSLEKTNVALNRKYVNVSNTSKELKEENQRLISTVRELENVVSRLKGSIQIKERELTE